MGDPDHPPFTIEFARQERVRYAGMIVSGITDISVLLDYRRWLTTSRLLGDVSEEEAKASYDRACNIYAASCGDQLILKKHPGCGWPQGNHDRL